MPFYVGKKRTEAGKIKPFVTPVPVGVRIRHVGIAIGTTGILKPPVHEHKKHKRKGEIM